MKQHLVTLSNGQNILLQEENDALTIVSCEDGEVPEWFICQINCNGVLVYPNSGSAPEYLTRGLKKDE